jgi:hypothetical protein
LNFGETKPAREGFLLAQLRPIPTFVSRCSQPRNPSLSLADAVLETANGFPEEAGIARQGGAGVYRGLGQLAGSLA